jgi:hypothetical protein
MAFKVSGLRPQHRMKDQASCWQQLFVFYFFIYGGLYLFNKLVPNVALNIVPAILKVLGWLKICVLFH